VVHAVRSVSSTNFCSHDMTLGYLLLAITLAVSLNHRNRFVRASGTLLAAGCLLMIVLSIALAHVDGSFAALRNKAGGGDVLRPLILSTQALIALAAAPGLVWAAWQQLRRGRLPPTPWRNSPQAFGLVSRYGHWITAVIVLCSIPIGLFIGVLPPGSPERAEFVLAHYELGVAVLLVVVLRVLWLLRSPAPPLPLDAARTAAKARSQAALTRAAHVLLYLAIAAMSISGLWLVLARGEALDLLGWHAAWPDLADASWASRLENWHGAVLPLALVGLITLHLAAVLKHHVIDGQRAAVRRMLG